MSEAQQLQAVSVGDAVYHYLREQLLSGKYKPGERINENAIAQELGVSRAPVREGVLRLSSEGLVQVVARKGTFALSISPKKVNELMDVRGALEGLAAREATLRATDTELEGLRAQVEGLRGRMEPAQGYPRCEFDFHPAILKLSQNEVLASVLAPINAQISFIRGLSGAQEPRAYSALQEHLEIVDAMQRREAELAERLMREHIARAKENFLALFSSSGLLDT